MMQGKLNNKNETVCLYCGKTFIKEFPGQKYCRTGHITKCEYCGKEISFTCSPSERPKYCSKECRELSKKKNLLEKYGVDNVSKLQAVKNKISKANSSEEVRLKREATCLGKYGTTNPSKSDSIKQKIKDAFLEKYGETNAMKIEKFKDKYDWDSVVEKRRQTMIDKYGVDYSFDIPEVKERFIEHNLEKFGVPYYVMTDEYRHPTVSNVISKINQKFASKLEGAGLSIEFEYPIETRLYDIHILNTNTLIEIDPTYTHNSFGNHWDKQGMRKDYHLDKSKLAADHGYRCIHVFDWDDWDKIINMIRYPTKLVYGRSCKIVELDPSTLSNFEDDYHIQKSCNGQTVRLGLYYNSELVEIMTFGKPRYNKHYEWELLRLCSKSQYRVAGGASKLFNYFINTYHPLSIISYCDISKFTGEVYERLGMKLDHLTPPAKIWSLGDLKLTDNLLRQRGYDQLFGTNYGKGTSNEKLMLDSGWLPVYDCGQGVYVWTR